MPVLSCHNSKLVLVVTLSWLNPAFCQQFICTKFHSHRVFYLLCVYLFILNSTFVKVCIYLRILKHQFPCEHNALLVPMMHLHSNGSFTRNAFFSLHLASFSHTKWTCLNVVLMLCHSSMPVSEQWTNQKTLEAGQALQGFVYSCKLARHIHFI